MPEQIDYEQFYASHFIEEHRHPATIAAHVGGTIAGLALIGASLTAIPLAWALAFPIVHVVPGLIAHRLFERNAEVGDARVLRKDFPLHWFLRANHRMTAEVLTGRYAPLKSEA